MLFWQLTFNPASLRELSCQTTSVELGVDDRIACASTVETKGNVQGKMQTLSCSHCTLHGIHLAMQEFMRLTLVRFDYTTARRLRFFDC